MSALFNKRFVLFTVITLITSSLFCQNNKSSILEFNKQVHDFGDILLSSGKQSCTFTFKNVSNQPVIIQTVISSCGCTTPQWTRNPINPGGSGKIDVTFLNDQGPYPFDKSLTVYVSGSPKPIILRIKGVVHAKKKNVKQLFPQLFGQMGLRKSPVDLGQVMRGTIEQGVIEVANTSGSPIRVSFVDLTRGLTLTVNPTTIPPGDKAELSIGINAKNFPGWGLTTYEATPVINGKKISKKLIFQATLREDFSNMTKEEIANSSLPMASKSSFNFGTISSGTKIETTFELKNIGRSDLLIHKIDVSEKGMGTDYPQKISPGATGKISVSIDTKGLIGEKIFILTLITNSPSRPLVNLLVTGEITK